MHTTVTGRFITEEPPRVPRRPTLLSFDFAAIEQRVMQAFCAHKNTVRLFEEDRLSLKCIDCGHESPGWRIGK